MIDYLTLEAPKRYAQITKIDLDFSGQISKKSHFDSLVLPVVDQITGAIFILFIPSYLFYPNPVIVVLLSDILYINFIIVRKTTPGVNHKYYYKKKPSKPRRYTLKLILFSERA
ncbi:hypothetical protein BpHYR1_029038 [Brachionus plicatilis]|uniref:Uncharacterized protein n=1 Tax=Brachionus plicatilis TaxID=10195 RepID=A0A3M7RZL3_BRAPC|nr:hypothetical protein BpHYR1_029038 [Brachionus plicatilis]